MVLLCFFSPITIKVDAKQKRGNEADSSWEIDIGPGVVSSVLDALG